MPIPFRSHRLAVVSLLVLLLSCSSVAGCGLLSSDEDEPEPAWIALTAVYNETLEGGAPIERIVLVDFNDPTHYRVLAGDSVTAGEQPHVSPDGKRIVFANQVTGVGTEPLVTLLDVDDEVVSPLDFWVDGNYKFPLAGPVDALVWDADGNGFYAATYGRAGFGAYTYYYDIDEGSFEPVSEANFRSTVLPYGLKGRDSLIVFSDAPSAPGDGRGYFFMSLEGKYLARIDNPQLENINRDGVTKRGAYYPAWSDELGLFAFSRIDSTVQGFKIAVTNLDGSYYREYTSGKVYLDRHPRWGPHGTILFDRVRPRSPGAWRDYRVMVLDTKTGEVRELADPAVIDSAAGLRFPDY